jgi:hypothetical protein
MCHADRTQALALVSRFKRDSPINADSDLAAEAAAWMLFAMYWCGASHPATLFKKSFSSADRYGAMDESISCESAKHLCA